MRGRGRSWKTGLSVVKVVNMNPRVQSDALQIGGGLTAMPRLELGVPGSRAWPWGIASEHRARGLEMPAGMPQRGEKGKAARL